MSRKVASQVACVGVAMIAATSLSVFAVSAAHSQTARAAETCAAAPQGAAPAGSHWRYRTERASQKKCWYLASENRKARRIAQPAEPPPPAQTADEAPTPPHMKEFVARLTQPFERRPSEVPARSAEQNDTRSAANAFADQAPSVQAPNPVTRPAEGADQPRNRTDSQVPNQVSDQPTDQPAGAVQPQEQVNEAAQAPAPAAESAAPVEPPAPVEASAATAAPNGAFGLDADTMRLLPFAIGALAAACFAAAAILFASRRRQDTIVRIVDLNAKAPGRWSSAATAGQPLSSTMRLDTEDDADDGDRRGPPPWRRAA
jgi:hypothetical protein